MDEIVKNEQELIAQAQGKDTEAFSALVELYQERAIHTAYSFIGNFEDARDIAQEAFVKAYENLGGFRQNSRFYTWFYRILMNACKDFLRKKKVRRHLSFWFSSGQDEEKDPAARVASQQMNAAERMDESDKSARIRRAVEQLPIQQRSAFSLRYLDGMGIAQIAESMHLSQGAVKAHLWQAIQKIKKDLSLQVYGEETP